MYIVPVLHATIYRIPAANILLKNHQIYIKRKGEDQLSENLTAQMTTEAKVTNVLNNQHANLLLQ